MADVEITIGAALEQLQSSLEGAKGMLESFAEAFGVAFSIEAFKELISSMAELGEQIERTSAMLGVSVEVVQQWSLMAKTSGGSAEQMAMSMERLQMNLQRAQNPTSMQAQALHALGLSANELIGLSLDKQLDKIADATARFADGGNKTAAIMQLMGRGAAGMIPILDQGSAGMDDLRAKSDALGITLDKETVESLANLNRNLTLAGAALTALGANIVSWLAPALNSLLGPITRFISALIDLVKAGQAAEVVMHGLAIAVDAITLNFVDAAAHVLALKRLFDELGTSEEKVLNVTVNKKPQVGALDVMGKQRTSMALEAMNSEIKINDELYKSTVEHLNAEQSQFRISENTKTAMLRDAINQREQLDLQAVSDAMSHLQAGTKEYQKASEEILTIQTKAAADMQKINDKNATDFLNSWKSATEGLASTFSTQLDAVLAGTKTWSQAMSGFVVTMIEQIMAKIIALIAVWTVLNVVSGGTVSFAALLPKMLTGFAGGTDYVPATGPYMLHEGEAVTTAQENMSGGGSGTVNLNVTAIDAQSFASALMSNRSALVNALQTAMRGNPGMFSNAAKRAA